MIRRRFRRRRPTATFEILLLDGTTILVQGHAGAPDLRREDTWVSQLPEAFLALLPAAYGVGTSAGRPSMAASVVACHGRSAPLEAACWQSASCTHS